MTTSDGSTASYYELPEGATELQHLISHKDMNAQMGEIFREVYRYGEASHSDRIRGAKKIKFYIDAEIDRLEAEARGRYKELRADLMESKYDITTNTGPYRTELTGLTPAAQHGIEGCDACE